MEMLTLSHITVNFIKNATIPAFCKTYKKTNLFPEISSMNTMF